ncbi:hypothetical protein AC249_AIPGENE15062 [Exaiptasia diaphana]|nr:hypothetical protein AC249_AIPGENE15062 [Exaiptasia diaphana]
MNSNATIEVESLPVLTLRRKSDDFELREPHVYESVTVMPDFADIRRCGFFMLDYYPKYKYPKCKEQVLQSFIWNISNSSCDN